METMLQGLGLGSGDDESGVSAAGRILRPVLPIDEKDGTFTLGHQEARSIGEALAGDYVFADPFPHIVLENFLPEPVARAALEHFPTRSLQFDRVFEMGYAGLHKRQILPNECDAQAQALFNFFNSQPMLQFLEGLSNIQGLIPDPYFSGGGYHETLRGGKLGIHADFRINNQLSLRRRMNVIIYLNENWRDEYGGFLELWDRKMTAMAKAVAPVFNRCVIFNTDADSYHGHPDPLCTPDGVARRSIALYYYTASKEVYNEVPDLDTLYQARPNDPVEVQREARWLRFDLYVRQWVPPALLRYARALVKRVRR